MSIEPDYVQIEVAEECSSQDNQKESDDISVTAVVPLPPIATPINDELRAAFYPNAASVVTGTSSENALSGAHPTDKFFSALHPAETYNIHAAAAAAAAASTSGGNNNNNPSNLNSIPVNPPDVIFYEHDVVLNEDDHLEGKNVSLLIYRCQIKQCSFQTAEKAVLADHLHNYHNGEASGTSAGGSATPKPKEFQCDLCQMRFTIFANMQRHRMSHLGVRPFECKVCDKKFTRNDHLMEHIVRQHSKQRPYKCPFCIKSFSVRPSLKNHLASDHSGIPKDKVCRVCGFRASTVGGAKIHYTNTHLRNNNETSPTDANNVPMDVIDDVDLASVSQNFDFASQEVSVPTSTAMVSNELTMDGPGPASPPLQSFRRYSSMQSLLHLPSCSTLPDRQPPMGDGSRTSVSSSIKDRNNSTLSMSERNFGDTHLHCSSSDLKQEPVEIEDSHNSCSSSAGTQPTSTMEAVDANLTNNMHHSNILREDEEDEDTEVGNHMAMETSEQQHFMISRRPSTRSGDEDIPIPRPARVDRKPILSHFPVSNVSRYPDWRHQTVERTSQRSYRNRDQSDSKVTTSGGGGNVPPKTTVVSGQPNATQSEDETDSSETREVKPSVAGLHDTKVNLQAMVVPGGNVTLGPQVIRGMPSEPLGSPSECHHCGIIFPDSTLYFLHRGLHSDSNPWKCNYCGEQCDNKYDFYAHVIRKAHN